MNPRLVPWCIAATGFLAALTAFTWQGTAGAPHQLAQPRITVMQPIASPPPDHSGPRSPHVPVASDPADETPTTLVLPLPPATYPEPDPNVQPVPDDEPTVDDLPAPRALPDSVGAE